MREGYICRRCECICEKPKTKTFKGEKIDVCPGCEWPGTLSPWKMELIDIPGRCGWCGYASFKQAMGKGKLKGQLLRQCKECEEVINPDTGEVLRKGQEDKRYEHTRNN